MVIVPNSEVRLLISPLKLDDNNQITFSSLVNQQNYFYGLPRLTFLNLTYVRKDNVLRIPTHQAPNDGLPTFEDLLAYNYCMYRNLAYKDKWFYAFVTKVEYQNDGMTEVTLETDAFQSWQFDLQYKSSFIEREHVSIDDVGVHTLPEGLEHGPYVCKYYDEITSYSYETSKVIVGTTWLPNNTPNLPSSQVYGGVFSGIYYMAFDPGNAKKFILALDGLGRGDAIVTVFTAPNALCTPGTSFSATLHSKINNDDGTTSDHDYAISGTFITNTLSSVNLVTDYTVSLDSTLYGYTPKNKKLLCYPYNYLLVSNNQGQNAEFHYEDFSNNTPIFNCTGVLSPGCSIKLFPKNYQWIPDSSTNHPGFNSGLMAGKLPICSYQNDSFVNWMTQQSVNVLMKQVSTGVDIAMMTATGGQIGGGGTGLFSQQANYLSERYQHALVSPQASGNINGGDVSFGYGESGFSFYKMTIKPEYAQMIDSFFDQFGYKTSRVAIPNIHKRSNWDYIKTTSVNLEGPIPEDDMLKIKGLFDNGCTFWHTTTYFLDYTQTNSIL